MFSGSDREKKKKNSKRSLHLHFNYIEDRYNPLITFFS